MIAVLWVLAQLARDELADVAGADDDRVLEVGRGAAGTSVRATARAVPTRQSTSAQKARSSRAAGSSAGPVSQSAAKSSQAPTVARWKTPTKSSTVEWSVALLVAVVEAVELRNEEPAGKRADEEQIFGRRVEPRMRTALAEHELGKEEGQGEPDQVGDHERPTHEPPAPVTARAPALEDLERLPVGDLREVFRKRRLG